MSRRSYASASPYNKTETADGVPIQLGSNSKGSNNNSGG
jgi:hypothetical protein